MATLPYTAQTKPAMVAAPIRNRAAYTADGDNTNGVQAHAYQTARQMWHQMGGYFGNTAAMPAVSLDQPVPAGYAAVANPHGYRMADTNDGSVMLGGRMQQRLADTESTGRGQALGGLVHEFAHMFQNQDTLETQQRREGGADAFSRLVSPTAIAAALLAPPGTTYPGASAYDGYVAKALTNGRGWVLGGQFRKRS